MCLGIPGQVVRWLDHDAVFGRAEVQFDGVRRVCHMACVPDASPGDYVVVHAGIAISRIDGAEARKVLEELQSLDLADEFSESPHDRGEAERGPDAPQSERRLQ